MIDISSLFPLLQAPDGAVAGSTAVASSQGAGGMSFVFQIGILVVLVGVFYFLVIRPQSKKQKETEKMLKALKKGDKIVTIGGIHGVVSSVKDEKTVVVKVDDSCKLEFLRSAIASVVRDEAPEPAPAADAGSPS